MKLPKLTEEPVLLIDMTPGPDLALRILRAYRQRCNCLWADNSGGEETKDPLLVAMNNKNRERAIILDKAIKILEDILLVSYEQQYAIFNPPKKRPGLVIGED